MANANSTIRYNNDIHGNVWESYNFMGEVTRTYKNSAGDVEYCIHPDTAKQTWIRDYFGNVTLHTDYNGWHYNYVRDKAMQLLEEYMDPAISRTNTTLHDPKTYVNTRPPNSTVATTIAHAHFSVVETPTPNLHKKYEYNYGLPLAIRDLGIGKTQIYNYQVNNAPGMYRLDGKPTSLVIQGYDGRLILFAQAIYDALSRPAHVTNDFELPLSSNGKLEVNICHDPVGNRRIFSANIVTPCYTATCPLITSGGSTFYYTFDEADRVIYNAAPMINGVIQPYGDTGVQFSYQNGFRINELRANNNNHPYSKLSLTPDGLIASTHTTNPGGLSLSKVYERNNPVWINKIIEDYIYSGQKKHTESTLAVNEYLTPINGRFDQDHYLVPSNQMLTSIRSVTNYHSTMDVVDSLVSDTYTNGNRVIDSYALSYLAGDGYFKNTVTGTRGGASATARFSYDANFSIAGKIKSADESGYTYYQNTTDHLVTSKQVFKPCTGRESMPYLAVNGTCNSTAYFYIPDGRLLGGYTVKAVSSNSPMHGNFLVNMSHQQGLQPKMRPEVGPFVLNLTSQPVIDINEARENRFNNPTGWNTTNFQEVGPKSHIAENGETLRSIAYKLYGDSDCALMLALLNGLPSETHPIKAGHQLWVFPIFSNHNRDNTSQPYHEFLNIIAGNLSPHLPDPKPSRQPVKKQHHRWWQTLIKIIAIGIIILVAPQLAPILVSLAGLSMASLGAAGSALAVGVTAALSDAAFQGLAVQFHLQEKFSVAEAIEVGMTAGMGAYMGAGNIQALAYVVPESMLPAASQAVKVATLQVATQLAEMAAGIRKKFDPNAVALQVASAIAANVIEKGIDKSNMKGAAARIAKSTTRTVTDTLLGAAVTHTPVDIQSAAANMIGSTVVGEVENRMASDRKFEKKQQRQREMQPAHKQKSEAFNDSMPAWEKKYVENAGFYFADNAAYNARQMERKYDRTSFQDYEQTNALADNTNAARENTSRSFTGLMWDEVKGRVVSAYESGIDLVKHPGQHLLNSSAASLQGKGDLFFNAVSAYTGNVNYQPVDSETQRRLLASAAVTFGEQALLLAVGGGAAAIGRLGMFGRTARTFGAKNILNTGARQIGSVAQHNILEQEAIEFYETVRNAKSNYDVVKISKNTNIPEYRIQRIKDHLFNNEHILSQGIGRFDPDIEVADAWRRLQTGNFHQQDLNLLHHEYFESKFEGIFKSDYITAHNAAVDKGRTWDPYEFVTDLNTYTWRKN